MRPRRPLSTRTRAVAVAVAVAACTATAAQAVHAGPPGGSPAASPCAAADKGERPAGLGPAADFDGDGYQDHAVSTPEAAVGTKVKAGQVNIVHGSPDGVDGTLRDAVDLDTPGADGAGAVAGDEFGTRTVARDYNDDGFTDLVSAVAAPSDPFRRFAVVQWGSPEGLSSGAVLAGGTDSGRDPYMAGGDFDGDGSQDLAIGAYSSVQVMYGPFGGDGTPSRQKEIGGGTDEYVTSLAAGDMNGDARDDLVATSAWEETAGRTRLWNGTAQGLPTRPEELDEAAAATVGDVDGDGYGDLVVRAITDGFVDTLDQDEGTVRVLHGSPGGPGDRPVTLTQDTPGMPGKSEKRDQFGYDLSAGDVNGDGCADVAIGVPFETIGADGARKDTGAVVVLRGGPDGLGPAGAQVFSQATEGVLGIAEADDRFGTSVALRDLDGDGRDDLTVGAPGEDALDEEAGAAWVLPGTAGGITVEGHVTFGSSVPEGRMGGWIAK
jgi:hypothetical protein